jgi:hypothetical protein
MGVNPVNFASGGRRTEHLIPGVYSRSSAIPNIAGGVSAGNLCVLGKSNSGKPQTLLSFSSLSEAQEAIDGPLLKAAAYAFSPAPGYTPQRVFAMRVNTGTQSGAILKKSGASYISAKPLQWGISANNISISVSDGTTAGKKIEVRYKGDTDTIDNVGHAPLRIKYTGSGTAASAVNDGTTFTMTVDGADVLVVALATAPLVGDLYQAIQATGVFDVQMASEAADADDPTALLDTFASAAVAKTDYYEIRADGFALMEALKRFQIIDPASVRAEASAFSGFPDNTETPVQFTGGTNGAYDAAAWNAALAALAQENIQIVSTPETDPAIHALIKSHCEICGSVQNRRERKAWLGGAAGETPEHAAAAAKALGSSVVTRCYPWITANSPLSGAAEEIDAGFYACMLAGLESALDVNQPLTNKQMNVLAWGVKLTNAQLEMLIQAGVCAGGFDEDENLVNIRAVTTWQGSELQLCENSMVREDQYMNRDLRSAFRPVIGTPFVKGDTETARATLLQKARQWAGLGYLTPTDEGDNVWGVTVAVSGDAAMLTFNRNLTAPRNFVFITARNYIYQSATTVGI